MKKLLLIIFLIISNQVIAVEIVAICGGSFGYGYYLETGLVPKGEGGWGEEKISKGTTTIIRTTSNAVDLIYKDATDQTFSPSEYGGKIFIIHDDEERLVFMVSYPAGSIETYYLNRDKKLLVWTQLKYNALIEKINAFHSKCD